jgi:hypothetical protein
VLTDSIFTFLPPAKISWRPCSSYHLVSVAVMCIFDNIRARPPVLWAQKGTLTFLRGMG